MLLLEVATNWPKVWMVTIFGFLLVLMLLVVLIFILQGFGWVMQKATAPKQSAGKNAQPGAPGAPKKQEPKKEYAKDADGATMAAIAMSLQLASSDEEMAAVAMALNLYYNNAHDVESYALTLKPHATVWNDKSYGINNLYR